MLSIARQPIILYYSTTLEELFAAKRTEYNFNKLSYNEINASIVYF